MTDLPSLTIDAGVFAIPPEDCTKEQALQYIDAIQHWGSLHSETGFSTYLREDMWRFLHNHDLYPDMEKLAALISKHNIEHQDAHTITEFMDGLVQRSGISFRAKHGIQEVLFSNERIDPEITQLSRNEILHSYLKEDIVSIGVLREYRAQSIGPQLLILEQADKSAVRIRAQIDKFIYLTGDIQHLPKPPRFFESEVPICSNFQEFVCNFDAGKILANAPDDPRVVLAIRIALFRYSIDCMEDPDWRDPRIPRIGRKFRKICKTVYRGKGPAFSSKVLRTIVKVVRGEEQAQIHQLHGVREPDGYEALRAYVDNECRLHFWRCKDDEAIELASVTSEHNDFKIPRLSG